MNVVLTAPSFASLAGGLSGSKELEAFSAWSKAVKASSYIGPDAIENCYVAHDGLLAKLQLYKYLIKCHAPGCTFEARRKYKMKSVPNLYKMKGNLEGVHGWNVNTDDKSVV